jgi:hypothetical protein
MIMLLTKTLRGAKIVDTTVEPDTSPFIHEITNDESLAVDGLEVKYKQN